jgi:SAM-dependent methyltransferase
MDWWTTFFDDTYTSLWSSTLSDDRTRADADGLTALTSITPGSRVLDAPCGFGRISRALASRGALVLGVDQSAAQIALAEQCRGDLDPTRLRYLQHDLRHPLPLPPSETNFDVVFNVYSSLGYGTEDDDLAILRTLATALAPDGRFVLDTMHRDCVAARLSRGGPPGQRLPDGTLFIETPRLDPLTGRIETAWHWCGPSGSGTKQASLRIYTTEQLVTLLSRAGLTVVSLHAGLSTTPFSPTGPDLGGRVAILARR